MVQFRILACDRTEVFLQLQTADGLTEIPMIPEKANIYRATVKAPGDVRYKFRLQGERDAFPDPYSSYQPEGVHGFSQVWDHAAYQWQDSGWTGLKWEEAIVYELHVGTFSAAGTFQGAMEKLDQLVQLGINTVELMPVNQTPGRWNWGYDVAGLFTVNHRYGTPDDLKRFVDTCHGKGLAVLLDVVYNHFGPEGNYLAHFGPYFTEKHHTPWGAAINYDDEGCELARSMVRQNVRYWIETYHLDGLRLDAVHAIKDESPRHILQEIAGVAAELSHRLGRKVVIVAETDSNDVKLINPVAQGGYGIDAQWMDDFHHTVHALLTGENKGYYQDYGDIMHLEKVFRNYVYTGEYSRFRQANRGTDAAANPGRQFVVAIQTHDQVGNRARGERLPRLVDFPYLKAAAGLLFMAPYIPMLFMGEEYAEENPFLFFTDYIDPELKKAVLEGRRKEFEACQWEEVPDPEDDGVFFASKLTPPENLKPHQRQMLDYYRDLIRLRREHPALKTPDKEKTAAKVEPERKLVRITREGGDRRVTGLINLGKEEIGRVPVEGRLIFNSEEARYGGREKEKAGAAVLLPGQFILFEH